MSTTVYGGATKYINTVLNVVKNGLADVNLCFCKYKSRNMQIDRNVVIATLTKRLHKNPKVYALWLEGSNATDTVDEFSDLDIGLSVKENYDDKVFEVIEHTLSCLGCLDWKWEVKLPFPDFRKKLYHLENTSEYLIIDVLVYGYGETVTFIQEDVIQKPRIIFDKANIIKFAPLDKTYLEEQLREHLIVVQNRFTQRSRVKKYVRRKRFLEAFLNYEMYVIEPLLDLIRIQYAPIHYASRPVQAFRYVPDEVLVKLETFYQVNLNF